MRKLKRPATNELTVKEHLDRLSLALRRYRVAPMHKVIRSK